MDGDMLSISQIVKLSMLEERQVNRALSKGHLVDKSPEQVGRWLEGIFESKINKNSGRSASRQDRKPSVYRKWD